VTIAAAQPSTSSTSRPPSAPIWSGMPPALPPMTAVSFQSASETVRPGIEARDLDDERAPEVDALAGDDLAGEVARQWPVLRRQRIDRGRDHR